MCHSELAKSQPQSQEEYNKWAVKTLYEALNSFDVETVHRLVTPDLEWWFHGPPIHQHLMRMLTGRSGNHDSFAFVPLSIAAFGSTVDVEGHSEEYAVSWVHAWTITDGIITPVREYFNTSVTVARFGEAVAEPVSSPSVTFNCQSVWQSKPCDNNSVPGLVLAL